MRRLLLGCVGISVCSMMILGAGCAKEKGLVASGVMQTYAQMVSALEQKNSCDQAAQSLVAFLNTNNNEVNQLLEDYGSLSRTSKKTLVAGMNQQALVLNKQHWVPYKNRCPRYSPQIGKVLNNYLQRFGVNK